MKTANELVAAWPNADEVLKGTKYEGATEGEWVNDCGHVRLVPPKREDGGPVYHLFDVKSSKNIVEGHWHNTQLAADAKSNAAAVVTGNAVLREVVEVLKLNVPAQTENETKLQYGQKCIEYQNALATAQDWLNKQEGK